MAGGGPFDVWEVDPANIELLERVGQGGIASVFRGRMQSEEVAVKVIDWNKSQMGVKQQRAFDREVAIMPNISHENLVRFVGVTSLEKPFRIITEFCAGGCCFELLHQRDELELEWAQQHKMCVDVALAMDYLHKFSPQIIHRELKTMNLLLARPVLKGGDVPIVKVSDFGLSRMRDRSDMHRNMNIMAEPFTWMAPELYHKGATYDEKVDVFAYGMILFEIACREIPFEEEEPAAVTKLTTSGMRPDLTAVPPDCPDNFKMLMVDCWAHDAKVRPSFDHVVKALKTAVV